MGIFLAGGTFLECFQISTLRQLMESLALHEPYTLLYRIWIPFFPGLCSELHERFLAAMEICQVALSRVKWDFSEV